MEDLIKQVPGELQNLNIRFDRLEFKVDNIELELQVMKTEQQAMKADLETLKTEQKTIKDMLNSQGDHLHQIIKIVGTTNAYVEGIVQDIQQINSSLEEHQRVLERLSLRSITHEINIDELRRAK